MPIQLAEEDDGRILVVQLNGKLIREDYGPFTLEFERLLRRHGKLRVLFDMTGLHGWDAGAAWEDAKFDFKHLGDIDRLAMVGEKKWQKGMAMFFKPFMRATSRYFDRAELAAAHQWLREAGEPVPPPPSPPASGPTARG